MQGNSAEPFLLIVPIAQIWEGIFQEKQKDLKNYQKSKRSTFLRVIIFCVQK